MLAVIMRYASYKFFNSEPLLVRFEKIRDTMFLKGYLTRAELTVINDNLEINMVWLSKNLMDIEAFFDEIETTTGPETTTESTTTNPTTEGTSPAPTTESTTLGSGSLVASFAVVLLCAFIKII